MVAKIASGRNIRGALNYNENKVAEGKAELLAAFNYPKDATQLSFSEKFQRMQYQADLNETVRHKCVHISLNFDPSEKGFSHEKLHAIAAAYMQKIGYGEQPFLVYQHTDAAHPHLHIVTTTIKSDGDPIRLHNNWKDSEEARKEIEKEFNLIPAESKKQAEVYNLKPADLRKALYGKSETKASISNIVRTVVKNYKFTSLAQLNAALLQYNVMADRGEKGTRMYEKGGLIYSLVDKTGKKVGIPIKASNIYTRPTISHLESKYAEKGGTRTKYEERLRMVIDDVLNFDGINKADFIAHLKEKGVHVIFRENEAGNTYGVTYVDNKTCCVFNGSDLGKAYSAKGILERLACSSSDSSLEVKMNKEFVTRTLRNTNFQTGYRNTITSWAINGMLINAKAAVDGSVLYSAGHYRTNPENYTLLNKKLSAYLQVNGYTSRIARLLHHGLEGEILRVAGEISSIPFETIANIINVALQPVDESDYVDYRWLKKPEKDRKKRRR